MSLIIPNAPDTKNPVKISEWMNIVKSRIEQSQAIQNGIPVAAPLVGAIPYRAQNSWLQLAAGAAGQVLTQGTATAPIWANISSNLTAGAGITLTGTSTDTIAVTAGQIPGTITGTNAAAGNVGEYISSTVLSTSAVGITSGTSGNVTSIALTPGDWDVGANAAFVAGAATTATVFAVGISTSSAALPASPGAGGFSQIGVSVGAGGTEPCLQAGNTRVNINGTSTVYLVAQATFAISTMGVYGFIGARRRR